MSQYFLMHFSYKINLFSIFYYVSYFFKAKYIKITASLFTYNQRSSSIASLKVLSYSDYIHDHFYN